MTKATVSVVVATQRIDGTILPGTLFTPTSDEQHADLVALGAVREPTEAELAVHERIAAGKSQLDHDGDGKPGGSKPRAGRKSKADIEAEAAAAAEAEAAAAAEAEAEAAAAAEAEAAAAAEAEAAAAAGAEANIG